MRFTNKYKVQRKTFLRLLPRIHSLKFVKTKNIMCDIKDMRTVRRNRFSVVPVDIRYWAVDTSPPARYWSKARHLQTQAVTAYQLWATKGKSVVLAGQNMRWCNIYNRHSQTILYTVVTESKISDNTIRIAVTKKPATQNWIYLSTINRFNNPTCLGKRKNENKRKIGVAKIVFF